MARPGLLSFSLVFAFFSETKSVCLMQQKQSWWPDGQYTAPTDEALAFDLQTLKQFGLNTVRLHQKANSQRWYWYADSLGIIVLQDMIQKYGGATPETVAPFTEELI